MRFDQRTGQLAQGNVGFSGHDLDQKQHMRRKLACGAGGATLRLGRDAPLVAKCRRKPDCRARTNPEHAGRSPTGMPRRNVVKHTLSQIHRICFAHETPPVGSESHIQTYGNPPRFRSNAKCFKERSRHFYLGFAIFKYATGMRECRSLLMQSRLAPDQSGYITMSCTSGRS